MVTVCVGSINAVVVNPDCCASEPERTVRAVHGENAVVGQTEGQVRAVTSGIPLTIRKHINNKTESLCLIIKPVRARKFIGAILGTCQNS